MSASIRVLHPRLVPQRLDRLLDGLDHDPSSDLVQRQVDIEERHLEETRDRRRVVVVGALRAEQ